MILRKETYPNDPIMSQSSNKTILREKKQHNYQIFSTIKSLGWLLSSILIVSGILCCTKYYYKTTNMGRSTLMDDELVEQIQPLPNRYFSFDASNFMEDMEKMIYRLNLKNDLQITYFDNSVGTVKMEDSTQENHFQYLLYKGTTGNNLQLGFKFKNPATRNGITLPMTFGYTVDDSAPQMSVKITLECKPKGLGRFKWSICLKVKKDDEWVIIKENSVSTDTLTKGGEFIIIKEAVDSAIGVLYDNVPVNQFFRFKSILGLSPIPKAKKKKNTKEIKLYEYSHEQGNKLNKDSNFLSGVYVGIIINSQITPHNMKLTVNDEWGISNLYETNQREIRVTFVEKKKWHFFKKYSIIWYLRDSLEDSWNQVHRHNFKVEPKLIKIVEKDIE